MKSSDLQPGDWVIYRKTKFSTHPGPRASNVAPAEHGDSYVYTVDKFWLVDKVNEGTVTLRTRKGKRHVVDLPDPNLRKANWLERWWYRSRFESLARSPAPPDNSSSRNSDRASDTASSLQGKAG